MSFTPDAESLSHYICPDWFRDAKFGIWSHWGPQAVPMAGDWYARHMYTQGHRQYEEHLKQFGHPSEFGYKDIIPLWKAEKWDPEALMDLYYRVGARYFVSMGCHHDNFDLWNSRHNKWNAVNMGPKRDVLGDWQRAAKNLGLKFGVSEHLGASYTWWRTNKGADAEGPKAGVPYDGTDPNFEDLYHTKPADDDTEWYTNNPEWHAHWKLRIEDLLEQYEPDLLYSDGGLPFGQVGRGVLADYYNRSAAKHGSVQVVYNSKDGSSNDYIVGSNVLDRERGGMSETQELPWQTDTSIGDWYYDRDWAYRPASWVIHSLVDIVSKNGNLLLNVVQRPDGSLDEIVVSMLKEVEVWMGANSEAIYGTRPWKTFGEGPTQVEAGHFKEDFNFGAADIRYTQKPGGPVYATLLGTPDTPSVTFGAFAGLAVQAIKGVTHLGSGETVPHTHSASGLSLSLPPLKPSPAHSFRVEMTG